MTDRSRNSAGFMPRRAGLLLEAAVAMTVLVSAIGLLGAQLVGGMNMTVYAEEQTRASQLVDRMMALLELDPNTVTRFVTDKHADGDFGKQYPEWFWRATAEELEETKDLEAERKLNKITLEILYQPGAGTDANIENARVVRRLHLLKAAPGLIDLEKHFGVPAEKVETIKELLANIAPEALTENGEIDLRILMQSIGTQDLFALMPMLAGMGLENGGFAGAGGGAGGIADLLSAQGLSVDDLAGLLQGGLPGGISPELIQSLLGNLGGLEGLDLSQLGNLSQLGDLSQLGNLQDLMGGGGGLGQTAQLLQFIQSQLGDQLTPEQLNLLMSSMGALGGGGGGRGGGRGGPGGGPGGGRGGPGGGGPGVGPGGRGGDRGISENAGDERPDVRRLAEDRLERNRQWRQNR